MFKRINAFKGIRIVQNTLVLCDIDNTLIKYNYDWERGRKKPIKMCESIEEFTKRILKSNSELVLITQRDKNISNYTEDELRKLDIYYNNILYCDGKNKGHYTLENIDIIGYNKILFIDSEKRNLVDMYNIYGNEIEYYNFNK